MDCSPPGSSIHGILQARTLEWVAISFSRGSSRPRDQTRVSRIIGRRFTVWATKLRWALNPKTGILIREKQRKIWDSGTWGRKQRLESHRSMPRNIWSHRKLEEARKDSPLETSEDLDLANVWFQTSGLHKWEGRHFVCLKPPYLWYCVRATVEN